MGTVALLPCPVGTWVPWWAAPSDLPSQLGPQPLPVDGLGRGGQGTGDPRETVPFLSGAAPSSSLQLCVTARGVFHPGVSYGPSLHYAGLYVKGEGALGCPHPTEALRCGPCGPPFQAALRSGAAPRAFGSRGQAPAGGQARPPAVQAALPAQAPGAAAHREHGLRRGGQDLPQGQEGATFVSFFRHSTFDPQAWYLGTQTAQRPRKAG